jgi:hypothetical protein
VKNSSFDMHCRLLANESNYIFTSRAINAS